MPKRRYRIRKNVIELMRKSGAQNVAVFSDRMKKRDLMIFLMNDAERGWYETIIRRIWSADDMITWCDNHNILWIRLRQNEARYFKIFLQASAMAEA